MSGIDAEDVPGMVRDAARVDRIVPGLVISAVLLGGLLLWVGPREVVARIGGIEPVWLAFAFGASLITISCRAGAAAVLYRETLDREVGLRFFVVYQFIGLPRTLLPSGYVAGPPLTAYVVSRDDNSKFAPTLAALSIAEILNMAWSSLVPLVGGLALLAAGVGATTTLSAGVAVAGVMLVVNLEAIAALQSERFGSWVQVNALSLGERLSGRRLLGHVTGPVEWVGERVAGFVELTAVLTAERRAMLAAGVLTGVGWTVGVLPMYFGLVGLGESVPLAAVMFAVPLAGLAGIVPLPGGVGSIEIAMAGLLIAVTGVDPGTATVAALVHRLATYWLGLAMGVAAGAYLTVTGSPVVTSA